MTIQTLLWAIVQNEDTDAALTALIQAGLRVTHISSTGGFLRTGNATLVAGLERSQVARAIDVLSSVCRTRSVFVDMTPPVPALGTQTVVAPLEVQVGGAILFAVPVERAPQLNASSPAKPATWEAPPSANAKGGAMKLIVIIVPEAYVRTILDNLIAAEYRATLISTTGAFLRKGNATILIGVEAAKVNDVLMRIRDTCQTLPLHSEMGCATVFVVDVEQYRRM